MAPCRRIECKWNNVLLLLAPRPRLALLQAETLNRYQEVVCNDTCRRLLCFIMIHRMLANHLSSCHRFHSSTGREAMRVPLRLLATAF